MMSVLYLVTGATGHLGNNLVRELVSRDEKVRVLVLNNDKNIDKLPANIDIYYGDVLDRLSLEKFMIHTNQEELIVIHCAGIVTTYSNYDQRAYDVNVNGTQNMLDISIKVKVKKFIYISSVHALVEPKKGSAIIEQTTFKPDKIIGFYGKTKAIATQLVMDAVEKQHLNASIVFPSGIIGPHDYLFGHTTQLVLQAAQGKMNIWLKGGYDFVDVRDVVQAIIKIINYDGIGEGFVIANQYISFKDLMQTIDQTMQRKPHRVFIPMFLIRLAIPFLYIYYRLGHKKPLVTTYSLYTIQSNSEISSLKAQKKLHYSSRPLQQTIADTILWLKTIHRLPNKEYHTG